MKRVVFVVAVLACSAKSEPRAREPGSSPPPPAHVQADASPAIGAPIDAHEIVTDDAPTTAPDRPTTPRTLYPVLSLNPIDSGTRVTIGIGRRQGVNSTWKARLVDKEGHDVRRGELTITVIDQSTTWATTKLLRDWIPKGVQAHVDSH